MMTEQENAALVEWLQKEISLIQSAQDEIPFGLDYDGENTLKVFNIALAALTAEPIGWRYRYLMPFMKNADGTMGWVGAWKLTDDIACCNRLKGYEIDNLYTTPPAPAIPDGWRLVPVEPTDAMTDSGWDKLNVSGDMNCAYEAMIAAAPTS